MIALGQEETGVPRAAVVVVLVKAAAKGVEEQEDKDGKEEKMKCCLQTMAETACRTLHNHQCLCP